ncbi:FAD-dependent monooxygenase [Pseudorhodoferax sp. Leaf267]|uniref:FAD-dependent monooxygenase n=1 Tax=Pseudorhodoferax sp. Leaf267 TaxID=1736316 RepID=UPI0006FB5915|nr:FAD-dependent monooxygenase [Pseudorhodoferax sp. Leaf267]KQP20624.1 ubiquinone biosynthesis protein UbiH [Pseudorhodoferax sp. Leaf267]
MPSPPAFDICIRGGGIVGRTLALLMARERLRVALVPHAGATRAGESSDVRAYALNAASRALLEGLRCWPDSVHATAVQAMQVFGDDGGEVNFDAARQGRGTPLAWVVDVAALETRLAEAVRYQPQIEVLEQAPPAALTVLCEGKASSTRAEWGLDYDAHAYGQSAIATRLQCERPHGQVARQWLLAGEVLALLPLGGAEGSTVAVVWAVPQDRIAASLAWDDTTFTQALEQISHQSLGRLQASGERAAWPLQLAQARHFVGVRTTGDGQAMAWALAGDSAHTVHPLAGQGLNLGLGDAAELVNVLRSRESWRSVADLRLLRRYERSRKAALAAMRLATDGLQQLFAHQAPALQGLRNWGMKGFERSGPLKTWVARRAMGTGG